MNKNYILSAVVVLLIMAAAQTAFAKTASLSITSPLGGVSVEVGVPQTIKWTSSDYPAGAGVSINLLRQVSAKPNKFEFVKTIKKDAKNDGEEIWIPAIGDNGNNFVIQVSCSQSFVFPEGCSSANVSGHLAITDKVNRQSYTASAISSINEIIKKISDFLNFAK
ncbi:MAG: hypothetical protein HW401_690 [Parcubacteria group bacterium]|nr:hypothetical protein [Parcubacteria group bacterium]